MTIDFSAYIADRTQSFTGREWMFEGVAAWLQNSDAPRFFLTSGESGNGKTALTARLVQVYQGTVAPPRTCPKSHPVFSAHTILFCP